MSAEQAAAQRLLDRDSFLIEFGQRADITDHLELQRAFQDPLLFVIWNPFHRSGENWAVVRKGSPDAELQMDSKGLITRTGWNFILHNPIPATDHIGPPLGIFKSLLNAKDGWKGGKKRTSVKAWRAAQNAAIDASEKVREDKEWKDEVTDPFVETLRDSKRTLG